MSLSWTPFLNEFFSCLLLALLFSVILLHVFLPCCWEMLFSPAVGQLFCHSSRRSGSTPITVFWFSSFFALSSTILFHRPIVWLLGHFLRHHPIWPCLPKLLASVGAVFAPRRRCASARSSTCCATGPRAPHTLCLQSSSALGRHSFQSNYNTACLLVCSPYLMKQRVGLLNCFVFCSFSSTLW